MSCRKRLYDELSVRTYDYVLLNRDLDVTLHSLNTILKAERLRRPPSAKNGLVQHTPSG